MIRINLLPVRQVRKAQAQRRLLGIFAVIIVAQCAGMFLLYEGQASKIDDRRKRRTALQGEIDELKQQVGDFDKLKGQRDRLLKQRKVINSLYAGRTGPVEMLRELSHILSPGDGPTVDEDEYEELIRRDPNAGYNSRWNPRRVWIDKLDERGKRLNIAGKAKDYDDVAELLRRLSLSRYFKNVQLKRNRLGKDGTTGTNVVRFTLSCRVSY
jgi:type IV pilus assembly protein PilN